MESPADLAIVLLARDRYESAPISLRDALIDANKSGLNPHVYIADPGYPVDVIDRLVGIAQTYHNKIQLIGVGKHSNTNHAWNEVLESIAETNILCLENDVNLLEGCLGLLTPPILGGDYDVVVPVVYEPDGVSPHFRPVVATIDRLRGGGRRVALDRGRTDESVREASRTRPIQIFERHCFLITQKSALSLGYWDELMFCRTDLDLSLACHEVGLRIALVESAAVQLSGAELVSTDVPFFDYRWDEHRVGQSNARLIAKWQLIGYKRTFSHVFDARRRLSPFGIT